MTNSVKIPKAVGWRIRLLPFLKSPTWATNGDPERRWNMVPEHDGPPQYANAPATDVKDGHEIQRLYVDVTPWNPKVREIPMDRPVLLKKKGESVPFMGVRSINADPEFVDILHGTDPSGYGIYEDIDELEGWIDILPSDWKSN